MLCVCVCVCLCVCVCVCVCVHKPLKCLRPLQQPHTATHNHTCARAHAHTHTRVHPPEYSRYPLQLDGLVGDWWGLDPATSWLALHARIHARTHTHAHTHTHTLDPYRFHWMRYLERTRARPTVSIPTWNIFVAYDIPLVTLTLRVSVMEE